VLDEVCVADRVEIFKDEIGTVEFDSAVGEVFVAEAVNVFKAEIGRVEFDTILDEVFIADAVDLTKDEIEPVEVDLCLVVVVFFLASRIGASLATTATILPVSSR
jgi:hypothetical protein